VIHLRVKLRNEQNFISKTCSETKSWIGRDRERERVRTCLSASEIQLFQDSVHCPTFVIKGRELSGSMGDTKYPKQITDHQLLPGCGP